MFSVVEGIEVSGCGEGLDFGVRGGSCLWVSGIGASLGS